MAGPGLPGARERRALVQSGSAKLAEMGLAFLREGRWGEALECLDASQNVEGLAKLAGDALAAGDWFFYRQAKRALNQSPDPGEAGQLAGRAESAGYGAFASAARKSGE